jgi:hypothetical protein
VLRGELNIPCHSAYVSYWFVLLSQCLVDELNMYKAQVSEYKSDLEKVNKELRDVKEKYFAQVNQIYIVLHPKNLVIANSKCFKTFLNVYNYIYFLKLL